MTPRPLTRLLCALAFGATMISGPVAIADSFNPAQRDEIGKVVREYLM